MFIFSIFVINEFVFCIIILRLNQKRNCDFRLNVHTHEKID